MSIWKTELINSAHNFDFPVHEPIRNLSKINLELIWNGNEFFQGLHQFFKYLEKKSYKIQYRVMLSRYRGKTKCPSCSGSRLRKDADYVKINKKSISEINRMTIDDAITFFNKIKLNENEVKISKRIIHEINSRLSYLKDVGLGYLAMERASNSLSGGESQRINLATSIGSSLVGSMYILDEPSIGLHPRDTLRLIQILKKLRDVGNSVIVVEHDEEIMKAADMIIDIGPEAGRLGGEIVFKGNHDELVNANKSLTAKYLTGQFKIDIPSVRRKPKNFIVIEEAYLHNLQNISVNIPLNQICVVTGVSGSGKSTLVSKILFSFLERFFLSGIEKASHCKNIKINFDLISGVEFINQNPIGKSSRSNPITYTKGYDDIRQLFANEKHAKIKGFKPGYFSFNVDGGRCEKCQGEGQLTISMQFMADVHLKCDECNGKRFKDEVLEVKYKGKNISEVLEMTVEESLAFFEEDSTLCKKIKSKIFALSEVGLQYVQLGQASNTLSGGEAQRIKLASFLSSSKSKQKKLFIFDEPTTGLHFHDVKKLIKALQDLVEMGHHVIIIEHHMDIIKSADWIIDLGPEGGKEGGTLLFEGNPDDFIKSDVLSYTKDYLKKCIEFKQPQIAQK